MERLPPMTLLQNGSEPCQAMLSSRLRDTQAIAETPPGYLKCLQRFFQFIACKLYLGQCQHSLCCQEWILHSLGLCDVAPCLQHDAPFNGSPWDDQAWQGVLLDYFICGVQAGCSLI